MIIFSQGPMCVFDFIDRIFPIFVWQNHPNPILQSIMQVLLDDWENWTTRVQVRTTFSDHGETSIFAALSQ